MDDKISVIIQKLKVIDCPNLANKSDLWIKEVLLTQKSERDILIEWIFKRLGYSIKGWSEDLSRDNRLKALLSTACSLGLCPKEGLDIIQGTAKQVHQIKFWQLLVDIVLKKTTLSDNKHVQCSVIDRESSRIMSEQYQQDRSYISNICSSVDLPSLFNSKVHLFPVEILKDNPTLKECITSEELSALTQKNACDTFPSLSTKIRTEPDPASITLIDPTDRVETIEVELDKQLSNLQTHISTDFEDTYNQLKPYIANVSEKEGTDVGPAFEAAASQLDSFMQTKDAIEFLTGFETDVISLDSSLCKLQPPDLAILTELRETKR